MSILMTISMNSLLSKLFISISLRFYSGDFSCLFGRDSSIFSFCLTAYFVIRIRQNSYSPNLEKVALCRLCVPSSFGRPGGAGLRCQGHWPTEQEQLWLGRSGVIMPSLSYLLCWTWNGLGPCVLQWLAGRPEHLDTAPTHLMEVKVGENHP